MTTILSCATPPLLLRLSQHLHPHLHPRRLSLLLVRQLLLTNPRLSLLLLQLLALPSLLLKTKELTLKLLPPSVPISVAKTFQMMVGELLLMKALMTKIVPLEVLLTHLRWLQCYLAVWDLLSLFMREMKMLAPLLSMRSSLQQNLRLPRLRQLNRSLLLPQVFLQELFHHLLLCQVV